MALLADGLHMASHAAALSINAFAYLYARRHANDPQFSFGTGKVNALGGFTGAILLALFALLMVGESIHRLMEPVAIAFDQAIMVAVLGLIVNGVSVFILDVKDDSHGHHGHSHHGHHHDHNLRSAHLHVLADALTSVLAIGALLTGKYLAWNFMDPVMGIVGAILVARWSIGLLKDTAGTLLDQQAPKELLDEVRRAIEPRVESIHNLHVWAIGPGIYAAEITVTATDGVGPAQLRCLLPHRLHIEHVTIEVHAPTTSYSIQAG